ncbi:hypothetical protein REPUB_Repub06bG0016600 [Reevesia pubescens]
MAIFMQYQQPHQRWRRVEKGLGECFECKEDEEMRKEAAVVELPWGRKGASKGGRRLVQWGEEDNMKIALENDKLIEMVDTSILREGIDYFCLKAFAYLALSCVCEKPKDRSTISDVWKRLVKLDEDFPS